MKKTNRIISLLLAVLLVISLFPTGVLAEVPQPEWAQWNETPADAVTVTATVSKDGAILLGNDAATTRLEKVTVTVPYFDLDLYGLGDFARTPADNSSPEVIRRPTMLHAMIYLMELYYFGMSEDECAQGKADLSRHVDMLAETSSGSTISVSNGNDGAALEVMGSARSMFLQSFWGYSSYNLHYFRNHAEGLVSYNPSDAEGSDAYGWYSSISATGDYYLLEDGDILDMGMFTISPWGSGGSAFMADYKNSEAVTLTAGQEFTWTADCYETNWGTELHVPLIWQVRSDSEVLYTSEAPSLTFSYTFTQPGSYTVVGYDEKNGTDSCVVMPAVAKVTVEPEQTQREEIGSFAFMAVNADGFVVEPCYIGYAAGETLKDALKASKHTFDGIDSGFISAIDGKADNYSLHYDGDGYLLDTEASAVTALWFTANSSQAYTNDLLELTRQMARYNTAENGVDSYSAAKAAYDNAAKSFYQTSNAGALATALKNAIDKYEIFLTAKPEKVTMKITQGKQTLTTGKAVFTSEFGTVVETDSLESVSLIPASYSFEISDGSIHCVRGTVEVTEAGAAIEAPLPVGTWIASVDLGVDSGTTKWTAMEKTDVSDGGATFYIPDYKGPNLYPYLVRDPDTTESDTSHRVYLAGTETISNKAKVWASKQTALSKVIEEDSLTDCVVRLECRQTDKVNGYELYETFDMRIVRIPTLENLEASGDGTALKLDYKNTQTTYSLVTGSDTVDITPTALVSAASITVAGQETVSGQSTRVTLADCAQDSSGNYQIPVRISAPNGQYTQYTVSVKKVATIPVTFQAESTDVTVQIFNSANAEILPASVEDTVWTYRLIPGESYTYLSTVKEHYHATMDFTPTAENNTYTVASPKAVDWLTNLAAKAGTNSKYPLLQMDTTFTPENHSYTFWEESNSNLFYLQAVPVSTSLYTVTARYWTHNNSAYSDFNNGDLSKRKFYDDKKPNTKEGSFTTMGNFLATGGWGNTMTVRVQQNAAENGVTFYQDYEIAVKRTITLNKLTASANSNTILLTQKDTTTTNFSKDVFHYTAELGQRVSTLELNLQVLSSAKYDFDFTATVACGDWSETISYSSEQKPNTLQTVSVPMNTDSAETQTVTVTVSHSEAGSVAQTYTIDIVKLPPIATSFTVSPANATVFLTADATGSRVLPNADGTYTLDTDSQYTYIISCNGYVAQKATFTAGQENQSLSVTLEKAPDSTLKDLLIEGDWPNFRADTNNNGVVNALTPIRSEDTVLEWANQIGVGFDSGATGCPILVGGYLYTYAGNSIVKVNKDTGEVVASGEMTASSSFAINSPTYADGMIFVGLAGGRVQAFNAETLTSLWVYQDSLGGQPNCPIAYCDGYVYTGFWNKETEQANFVCLSVTDEDPTKTNEAKLATWTYAHNGFYWAGAYVCKSFVMVGTDDGASGYTEGYASVLTLDPRTGELLSHQKLPNVGDQRSSICYDEETDAYYFTTKGGDFYQIRVNEDGTFQDGSLRRLHLDNGSDNTATPPMSTSTPVVYKGRAYIGVSGTAQFGAYSGHNITVIDLDTFSIAYTVPTMGYPQTSGLLTTAYEGTDGYVYVYFIDNMTPGKLRVIRDRKGMTEVDPDYVTEETYQINGEEKTIQTAYVLFTPYGEEAQYAICSPIVDSEGNLYFKNDTAKLMRLSNRIVSLEVTRQPDKQSYMELDTFDGTGMQVIAHYANGTSKDISDYVSYTTDKLTMDDTEITVSYDSTKLYEKDATAQTGGYWKWYRDVDGAAGQTYDLPTTTVTITLTAHAWDEGTQTKAPTLTAEGEMFYTCSDCDATKVEKLPALSGKVDEWNVTLADDLRVNFAMEISPEILQGAQICVTLNGETTIYSAAELPTDEAGRPVFTVCMAAAQMTDAITVQVKNGEDAAPAKDYTVRQYCDSVLADSEMSAYHAIVKELLRYGSAAQTYFGYHTDDLADSGLTLDEPVAIPETAPEVSVSGSAEGVAFYGASLLFRNRIALRFYFTGDLSGCTVQVGGKTYTPIEKNGLSYIEIADILPQNLDEAITVQVLSGSSTLTVTYSPISYMVRMSAKGTESLAALLTALYNYHLAAKSL